MRRLAIGAIVLCCLALASPEHFFFPAFADTTADDASYVAYAMSVALDGDLDFSNEIARRLNRYPNRKVRPVHPAGPGIMATPVVAVLSIGDRLSGHPVLEERARLGGSWSYLGFFLASAGALMGGLVLARRAALAISAQLSPMAITVILAGTGLPFYGLKRFTMGHSFEFFAAGLILWGVVQLGRPERKSVLSSLTICAGVASSLLIRPANINIVLLPTLTYLILQLNLHTMRRCRTRKIASWWLIGATVLGVSVAFGVNAFLYGTPYPSFGQQYVSAVVTSDVGNPSTISAQTDSSAFGPIAAALELASDTRPRALTALSRLSDIPTVLVTQEFGILWFMPIVPIGVGLLFCSLVVYWRRTTWGGGIGLIAFLSLLYAAVPLGVILFWQSHASSFGFRYIFSLVPLGLLGLVLWAALPEKPRLLPLRPILSLILFLATFSLLGQMFFGSNPGLELTTVSSNAFGKSATGNPSFASSLLSAILQPDAWANMLARGLPGFVALVVLPIGAISIIGAAGQVVPQRRATTIEELAAEYQTALEAAAPGTIGVTLIAFGVLVPALFAWMMRRRVDTLGIEPVSRLRHRHVRRRYS